MARNMASIWGEAVARRGFAQIPNYLIMVNQFLDEEARLSPIQLHVIYQLVASWWEKDKPPFPSMRTIATRIGVSERQVMRSITDLERRGLLRRVKRIAGNIKASNAYDLTGLINLLNQIEGAYPNAFPRDIKGGGDTLLGQGGAESGAASQPRAARPVPARPKRIGKPKAEPSDE